MSDRPASEPGVGPFLAAIEDALVPFGRRSEVERDLTITGTGSLPSVFAVTDLATAAVASAARAAADLTGQQGGRAPAVTVDRRLASWWYRASIAPQGWELPPIWDSVAGLYRTSDGWIRLHTNAPHHRLAALTVLAGGEAGTDALADRTAVGAVVETWEAEALEAAIVAAGGCAAALRSEQAWAAHAQGQAVGSEPLLAVEDGATAGAGSAPVPAELAGRPLAGVRVLDLTRVLAGPVATRFLAGLGADVLRIDPPDWDEAAVVPEVVLGKRCARLDLRQEADLARLRSLLSEAHVLVHGYRPGALDGLGLGVEERHELAPGLVDVSLDAYGFTGPWAGRRGFDSLVQLATGIADTGRERTGADRPIPLPVQALDHTTGYVLAAAAIRGWQERRRTGRGTVVRASLARTAALLTAGPRTSIDDEPVAKPGPADYGPDEEATSWGPARRLLPPAAIDGAPLRWDRPATDLGSELPPLQW